MFKKLSMVLIAAMALNPSSAQQAPKTVPKPELVTTDISKHQFGFHGGPSISIFYNESPMESPRNFHRPTYQSGAFGISYQYNFNKMVGLRMETNYERKGDIWYDISSWENAYTFKESFAMDRISYITVPLTARLSFGKAIRFFVNGGMYAGITIKAQRVMHDARYVPFTPVVEGMIGETNSTTDITTDVSAVDGGVVIGVGGFFPIGKMAAFTLEARNNTGFVNLNANTGLYQNRFYSNSTALLLGLSFFLDKPAKSRANLKM